MTLLHDADIGGGSVGFAKDFIGVDYHNDGHSQDTWISGDGKAFQPQVHYFVGGATKLDRRRPLPDASRGPR